MKKLILSLLVGAFCLPAIAQPELSGKAEFVSSSMFRGFDNSSSAALNPEFNLDWGGFNFNAWGDYAFDNSYSEVDLTVSYSLGDFTLALADYFYPNGIPGAPDQFFNFKKDETFHQLDAMLTWEPENIPVWAQWSTYVGGDDYNYIDDKRAFSSYLEAGWYHEFENNLTFSAYAGASVFKGWYTDFTQDFSVVNLGMKLEKTFSFDNVSFPVSVTYTINPYLEKSFIVFGAAIEF